MTHAGDRTIVRGRRLAVGGFIDRARPLSFTFDGADYEGFAGDTLASALLANGVDVVAHGIYTDRPRGILTADGSEPNAWVGLEHGGGLAPGEPMVQATRLPLRDGLRARSLAGIGAPGDDRDDGLFDQRHGHVDVAVIGGGPAGLAAARAATRSGARVLLADDGVALGGQLLVERASIDGLEAATWIDCVEHELDCAPDALVLRQTTALGIYDHGSIALAECPVHRVSRRDGRLWIMRAKQFILATGATERPVVFADNDRPGILLASAARTYLNRYAVLVGRRVVIFTTNGSADRAALELADAGAEIVALVDARANPAATASRLELARRGVPVYPGHAVAMTAGDPRVVAATVTAIDAAGAPTGTGFVLPCDTLLLSGGWNPNVQLVTQGGGTLRWDETWATFVPDRPGPLTAIAGAVGGPCNLDAAIAAGHRAGIAAAEAAGFAERRHPDARPTVDGESDEAAPLRPLWWVPPLAGSDGLDHHFIDLARDAPVVDIERALRAGLRSVEHIKRFTTIGTGPEQGRLSGLLSSAIVAGLTGQQIAEAGITSYRPPAFPISFAQLAGRARRELFSPLRTTAIDPWHAANGAVFENAGLWRRPRYFPRPGETMDDAVRRESIAARTGVAIMDASTLGKIDVRGPDAGSFLDRIYTNNMSTLAVGSCRYGLMCGLDGMVIDDGVASRLAEDHFHLTTTSGNAVAIYEWLEEWLQTEWPELNVFVTSVTEQWSTIVLAGPHSREVIAVLAPGLAADAAAFPFMSWRDAVIGAVGARIFRISFSGELAYEVNVPAWYGLAAWDAAVRAGEPFGVTPYGLETLNLLRAEKGYPIVGVETDGSVTPQDLGLGWAVSKRTDFVGRRSMRRPDMLDPDREQLVALLPADPEVVIPEGAQLVADPHSTIPMTTIGHVTSSHRSAVLGRTFSLAMVRGGRARMGQSVYAPVAGRDIAAAVAPATVFDPENRRRDGAP